MAAEDVPIKERKIIPITKDIIPDTTVTGTGSVNPWANIGIYNWLKYAEAQIAAVVNKTPTSETKKEMPEVKVNLRELLVRTLKASRVD